MTQPATVERVKPGNIARLDAFDVITEILWERLHQRHPTGLAQARELAHRLVRELRRERLIIGITDLGTTAEILQHAKDKAAKEGEAPRRGISHFAAEALVLLNLPTVHRDVIAALMPDIRSSDAKASVQQLFNRAIRKFDNFGWIRRNDNGLIEVVDQNSLAQWFEMAEDANGRRAKTVFDIAKAVNQINARLEAGEADELHRRELHAIQRLMENAPGAVTNARGTVRLVGKPRIL